MHPHDTCVSTDLNSISSCASSFLCSPRCSCQACCRHSERGCMACQAAPRVYTAACWACCLFHWLLWCHDDFGYAFTHAGCRCAQPFMLASVTNCIPMVVGDDACRWLAMGARVVGRACGGLAAWLPAAQHRCCCTEALCEVVKHGGTGGSPCPHPPSP